MAANIHQAGFLLEVMPLYSEAKFSLYSNSGVGITSKRPNSDTLGVGYVAPVQRHTMGS